MIRLYPPYRTRGASTRFSKDPGNNSRGDLWDEG
jgi:hypothetical protein